MKSSVNASAAKVKGGVSGLKPAAKSIADKKNSPQAKVLPGRRRAVKGGAIAGITFYAGTKPEKFVNTKESATKGSSKVIHKADRKANIVKVSSKTVEVKPGKEKTNQAKARLSIDARVAAKRLIRSHSGHLSQSRPAQSDQGTAPVFALSKMMLRKKLAAKGVTRKQGGVSMKKLPAKKIKSLIQSNIKEAGPSRVD